MTKREREHLAELERRIDSGEAAKPKGTGLFQVGRIDPGGAVNHEFQRREGKLPVSLTLPRASGGRIVNRFGQTVREIKPGLYATMEGKRIVDSSSAADRHAADCGYVRFRD